MQRWKCATIPTQIFNSITIVLKYMKDFRNKFKSGIVQFYSISKS